MDQQPDPQPSRPEAILNGVSTALDDDIRG
jgi:hypothetical protein